MRYARINFISYDGYIYNTGLCGIIRKGVRDLDNFIERAKCIALKVFYFVVSSMINILFEYENGIEYMIGTIIGYFILEVLEVVIRKKAYRMTGQITSDTYCNKFYKSSTHWKFRVLMILGVYAISLTPLCNIAMTNLVHSSTQMIVDSTNAWIQDFSNDVVEVLAN